MNILQSWFFKPDLNCSGCWKMAKISLRINHLLPGFNNSCFGPCIMPGLAGCTQPAKNFKWYNAG